MAFLQKILFRPVDGASLAAFRIGFGLLGVGYTAFLFREDWIAQRWIEPVFHFYYPGFRWVAPWPGGVDFGIADKQDIAQIALLGNLTDRRTNGVG